MKWIDYENLKSVQNLINIAVTNFKNLNLDKIILEVNSPLSIDRYVDKTNEYFTIHNGTILIKTENLFYTTYKVTEHPRSQYIKLKDIVFKNTEGKRVNIFKDNHFLRTNIESCVFDGVSLGETEKYLQSYYIYNSLILNMQYDWITANVMYDLHFFNNAVEASRNSIIFNINNPKGCSIISNLIESVKKVITYTWSESLSVIGNYFEMCTEGTIEGGNMITGNVSRGTTITGNRFMTFDKDAICDHNDNYYHINLGFEKNFLIQGNRFSTSKTKNYISVHFKNVKSFGIYITADIDDDLTSNYSGHPGINMVRSVLGNKENINTMSHTGILMPSSSDPNKFKSGYGYINYYYPNSPYGSNYHDRAIVNKIESKAGDKLLELTTFGGKKEYFPNTYKKLYSAYNKEFTPWIKTATMIDANYGIGWDAPDLLLERSNSGTMRFHGQRGLEIFYIDGWKSPDGLDIKILRHGDTSKRPQGYKPIGFQFFDTKLNKPIWWNGKQWVDANGNDI